MNVMLIWELNRKVFDNNNRDQDSDQRWALKLLVKPGGSYARGRSKKSARLLGLPLLLFKESQLT